MDIKGWAVKALALALRPNFAVLALALMSMALLRRR